MPDKAWKAEERRVAALYDTRRVALSGQNNTSAGTLSDSQHESLYIESKSLARIPFWALWLKTVARARKEGKAPVLVFHKKGSALRVAMVDAERHAALERFHERHCLFKPSGTAGPNTPRSCGYPEFHGSRHPPGCPEGDANMKTKTQKLEEEEVVSGHPRKIVECGLCWWSSAPKGRIPSTPPAHVEFVPSGSPECSMGLCRAGFVITNPSYDIRHR